MATPKQAALNLIDHLPDQANWDDIMYELYVKQKIEALNVIVWDGWLRRKSDQALLVRAMIKTKFLY